MGQDSKIEWADATVNPWWGCSAVSEACKHCYAERQAVRRHVRWGLKADRWIRVGRALDELQRLSNRARREQRRLRVFVASMADVFEDREDLAGQRRVFLYHARAMGPEAGLDLLFLTKRPEVMAAWARQHGWEPWWWAGTTVETQARADERIPHLLDVPATVRFLSCEPLLGPLDLHGALYPHHAGGLAGAIGGWRSDGSGITWVIAGGESGPKARPSHPSWFRRLRDDCVSASVPFFFKQWGEWAPVRLPWDADYEATAKPSGMPHWDEGGGVATMLRIGKRRSGALLDGLEWKQTPWNGGAR